MNTKQHPTPLPLTAEQILDQLLVEAGQPPAVFEPLVAVSLKSTVLHYLRTKLDRELNAKARGWNPTGFTLLELLEIERLLIRHLDQEPLGAQDNLMLTYGQVSLLATYVNRYYELASYDGDQLHQYQLGDAFDALTVFSTMTFPFYIPSPQYPYGVPTLVRTLAVFWSKLRAAFTGHRVNQPFDQIPAQA